MTTNISPFSYLDNPDLNLIKFSDDKVYVTYSRIKKIQDLAVWFFSKVISLITFSLVSLKYDEPRIVMLCQHLTHLQNNPSIRDQDCIVLFEKLTKLAEETFIPTETKDQIATLKNTLIQSHIRQIEGSELDYPNKLTALDDLLKNPRIKPETKDQIATLQNTLIQSYIEQIRDNDLDSPNYQSKLTGLTNFVNDLRKKSIRLDEATRRLLIKATCKIYINALESEEQRKWINISNKFRKFVQEKLHPAISAYHQFFSLEELKPIVFGNLEEEVKKLDDLVQKRIKNHLATNSLFLIQPSSPQN